MENRFTVGEKDYFIKLTPQAVAEGKKAHNRAFRDAIDDGALLKKSLMNHMREQGVWNDSKEENYKQFIKEIGELEYKLSSGKMKVSEGKTLAIQLSKKRAEFRSLISERNQMEANSVEAQADNARFNALLAKSIFDYDTQKLVYDSVESYVEKGSDELGIALAEKFANFIYGVDEKYEDSLVENKFLKRFKLVNESGHFIDKAGRLVDIDGCQVDEEGYRLDKDGKRIDLNGNPIGLNIEDAEFEDDFTTTEDETQPEVQPETQAAVEVVAVDQ